MHNGAARVYRAAPLLLLEPAMKFLASRIVILVASLCACSLAAAQYGFTPGWAFHGAPEAQMLHQNYVMQQIANGTYLKGTGKSSAKAVPSVKSSAPLTFDARSQPIAPAKLARAYPQETRAKVEQVFGQTLDTYHKLESQFGLRRNDLGGALAAFVAGNYAAYRDEAFADKLFKPLVQQMQGVLQSTGSLEKAGAAEKQELYENLAILGTYMLQTREALQKSPDAKIAANMKAAARAYLQQVLKLDPDRMHLTDKGLVVN
jgi:hypothetical protein